jgi:hypothetical protein
VWKGLRGGIAGKCGGGVATEWLAGIMEGASGGDPSDWDREWATKVGGRRGGSELGPWDATLAVKLPSHCSPRDIGLFTGASLLFTWNPFVGVITYL